MAITDLALRRMKPGKKRVRISVGGSLSFTVEPDGRKWWYFAYRFGGKQKSLSMGVYPAVPLKEACEQRDAARKLLDAGKNPSEHRKNEKIEAATKAENTFQAVALEWFEVKRSRWCAEHAGHIIAQLTNDVFPSLGARPISEITPPELLRVIRCIQSRAVPTAHRILTICGQVFRYAIGTGRVERDPSFKMFENLKPKPKAKNRASITNPDQAGHLMRTLDSYDGWLTVRCALRLAPYVFCRPGELVKAEWKDIDFEKAEWTFHVTKVDIPHIVPLSGQALEILRELKQQTGESRYVFPQMTNDAKHIATDTVRLAMRSCGIPKELFTTHGVRAMARTLLHEVLHYAPEVIEKQLSHIVADANGTAYNRTKFLDDRRRMMQEWADYLDGLKSGNIRAGNAA